MASKSIKDRFKEIRSGLSEESDPEIVLEKVKDIFREANYMKRPHEVTIAGLFRATQYHKSGWFNNSRKLNYPPRRVLKNYGRCNCPHSPVFYCSDENIVPMYEIRPKLNNYVTVSSWKNKAGGKIKMRCLVVGAQLSLDQINEDSPLKRMLENDDYYRSDISKSIKEVDDCIGELFAEAYDGSDNFYWLTYAITWCMMNLTDPVDGRKIDGLIYPSVARNLEGINVVLTTEYVDNNLLLGDAAMYKVIEVEERKYAYKLVKGYKRTSSILGLKWQPIETDKVFNVSDQSSYPTYTLSE